MNDNDNVYISVLIIIVLLVLLGLCFYMKHLRNQARLRDDVKTILFNYLPLNDFEMRPARPSTEPKNSRSYAKTNLSLPESLAV